ncbi:dickkopf-related protein 3-like [Patiria miniata]|uniref:Dickkopf N-terminal cysteine-rich domain-containing protein n=1 Tax=Patiria miniata TaxID=46514 RepID=A0A914BPQ2_PATMI|nr:dickkopf-related protein 3-like [Patiria miniata]
MMVPSLNSIIAFGLLILLTVLPAVEGYLLAWAYGRQLASGSVEDDAALNHPRNVYGRDTSSASRTRDENGTSEDELRVCKSDKACGRGFFCDRHYGECLPHHQELEPCRRDGHCDRGLECRFGTCQEAIKSGNVGARCKNDKDCGDTMCCAKQHGESVCKARLPLDAKCYVPAGGVEYTIDSICPCMDGLTCRRTRERREEELVWQFWTDYDHMRCSPIHLSPHDQ